MRAALTTPVLFALAAPVGAWAAEETSGGGFAPLESEFFSTQIFWFFLSFVLLYFILSKLFLPAIGETLEERSSRIADDIDSASRMQREAGEAETAYETALKDARAKAHTVAEATQASIDAEVQAEIAKADIEAEREAALAEDRIRDIRARAMADIDATAADIAQATVKKLAGLGVTQSKAATAVRKQA